MIQQLLSKMSSLRPTETKVSNTPVGTAEEPEVRWVKTAEGKWVLAEGSDPQFSTSADDLGELRGTHTEMHGFRGDRAWKAPRCVLRDASLARSGYTAINRDEFEDSQEVLAAKVKVLASMIRRARFPCAYTGAGISTASGIPDYATGSSESRAALPTRHTHPLDANPSDAHLVLARLHLAGLMKAWVQQNHDGLPQKAGFPQAMCNEIHGAWWDPSNPVVPMSGELRTDLFQSLLELENTADFCLCVGTSLSGMNADRAAVTPGQKAKRQHEKGARKQDRSDADAGAPGLVIINLQRTQHDDVAALRIFAKASVVLSMLAEELQLPPLDPVARDAEIDASIAATNGVCVIPYSPCDGARLEGVLRSGQGFELDLREGSEVRISRGKYAGDVAVVTGRTRQGHFKLTVSHDLGKGRLKAQVPVYLGKWWVVEALRGAVPVFPLLPKSTETAS